MRPPPPIFFFGDLVVGEFLTGTYPKQDGDIGYAPFKGLGHLQLQAALKSAGKADCYFKQGNKRVDFEVIGCPKYRLLKIRGLG